MDEPQTAAPTSRPRLTRRRITIWLTIALLLTAGGLAFKHYYLELPVGLGPAGPTVDRGLFGSTWTSQHVHVLAAGDSITAGLGADNDSHRSFDRLLRCPDDEFPEMQGLCLSAVLPDLTYQNMARSGSNSVEHLDMLKQNLRRMPADALGIVILTTGGNDIIHWYGQQTPRENAMYGATLQQAQPWIENYEHRLNEMLDLIVASFPGGCHIFIGDIYDPTDGRGAVPFVLPAWPDGLAIHSQYNRVIHATAEKRPEVHVVPLHQTFLGHGIDCRKFWRPYYCPADPTYWYYDNIEDPNDRGHDAVRRAFLIEIARVLAAPPK